MWRNKSYILDCAWGKTWDAMGGIIHPDLNNTNKNCTESIDWLMLHWCASILLWLGCDTNSETALYKLPYLFNASQHKNHVTECLRKLPVWLYTPLHCIPNVPESIQMLLWRNNRHIKAEHNHRCLIELDNVYHKPKQLKHRF